MVSKVNVPGILTVTFWVALGATTMRLLISALMAMTFCLPSKKAGAEKCSVQASVCLL